MRHWGGGLRATILKLATVWEPQETESYPEARSKRPEPLGMSPRHHELNKRKETWAGVGSLDPSQFLPLRLGDYRPAHSLSDSDATLQGEARPCVQPSTHRPKTASDDQSQVGPFPAPYGNFFMVGSSAFSHAMKL